jgi:hypothetical protein
VAGAEAGVAESRSSLDAARAAVVEAGEKVSTAQDALTKARAEADQSRAAADAVPAADLEAARAAVAAAGDDKDAKKAADRALRDLEKPGKDADKAAGAVTKAEGNVATAEEARRAAEADVEAREKAVADAEAAVATVQREAAAGRPRSTVVPLASPPDDGAVAEFLPHEVAHRREYHPHESPWTMLVPLVILSIGAIGAGVLNLPFSGELHVLEHWLEPSLFGNEIVLDVPAGTQVALAFITTGAAVLAILGAAAVYLKYRGDRAKIEQPAMAHAWYVDETYAAVAGGPGRQAFEGAAVFDRKGVDGAVNGIATAVREAATGLRVTQTGFVRSYALGITIGAVALLGLFLSRAAF